MNEKALTSKLEQTLTLLRGEEECFEIRILNTPNGVVSGLFNDVTAAAEAVLPFDGQTDVYVTLNPVKTGKFMATHKQNTLISGVKRAIADTDISEITFILVDIDPIRSSKTSATEDEKQAGFALTNHVKEVLCGGNKFPDPIMADSGNGYHLLFRTMLENTNANKKLIKAFLVSLDRLYSNAQAQVDTTTYNPSRIIKLYGTMACKGENTAERPHRRSKILDSGGPELVTVEQLEAIANLLPKAPRGSAKSKQDRNNSFDLETWLNLNGLDVVSSKELDDGAVLHVLDICPWNAEHTNRSAYIIEFQDGGFHAGCHHNSCSTENWETLITLYPEGAPNQGGDKGGESQTNTILRLTEDFRYFLDEAGEKYVATPWPTYTEIMPMEGQRFKLRLTQDYYNEKGEAPRSDAVTRALDVLRAKALFDGETKKLQPRVASEGTDFFYDLGDPRWKAIKINETGVTLEETPPALFVRSKNTAEQKLPDWNSPPEALYDLVKKHFRWKSDTDINLFIPYLVSCFLPQIPHPVLVVYGEKGSAKSTTLRMIKKIVDPARQELLAMPSHRQELAITLTNNFFPCFDNLESLSIEKSNMLCMAATGGAFTARTLYTNSEETILSFKRPVALNGINVVATRSDLLDRSVILELSRIPYEERQTEQTLWKVFEKDIPKFLGSIFNTISQAIPIQGSLELNKVGRMADFTYWGYAISEVTGISGKEFLKSYLGNQDKANEEALAGHPVGAAILAFMRNGDQWVGPVSSLLKELEFVAQKESINTKVKTWAKDPNVLSRRLNEVKSNLEELGVYYDIRNTGSYREISLIKTSTKNTVVE